MKQKKRNVFKKIFILCLAVFICTGLRELPAWAEQTHVVEGLEPKVSGDYRYVYCEICQGIAIIQYTGKDKVVHVPDKIDGTPVKEIAYNAFASADYADIRRNVCVL